MDKREFVAIIGAERGQQAQQKIRFGGVLNRRSKGHKLPITRVGRRLIKYVEVIKTSSQNFQRHAGTS